MDAKTITIPDCEKYEEKLTQQAIDYTNMIRNPEQKAETAKEVITGLADRNIYLAQKNGADVKLKQVRDDLFEEIVKAETKAQKQYEERSKELSAVKGNVTGLVRSQKALDEQINACSEAIEQLEGKFQWHLKEATASAQHYNERISAKASKRLVWTLTTLLTLQSAYAGYELVRNPNKTLVYQAYQSVKNWLNK